MDKKKGVSKKFIIVMIAVIAAAVFAYGRIRLLVIGNEVKQLLRDAGISAEYYPDNSVKTKEAFLKEIWELARWESETRAVINETYGYSDKEFSYKQKYKSRRKEETRYGYEDRKEIYSSLMEKEWYRQRVKLQYNVEKYIAFLFELKRERYGLLEEEVQICYSHGFFDMIPPVMEYAQKGMGEEAFEEAKRGLMWEPASLSMDIAYGLYPELMTDACRNYLQRAMDENGDVSDAVLYCKSFQRHYGVEIDGLKAAIAKKKRLEYDNKPDVPEVGMTVSRAYNTKLGAPTRKTSKKSTYAGADHYWGHLYWEKGGREIFSAYYGDDVIKDVWDTRDYQGKPSRKFSGSSGKSSGSSFDPDDHDIEAYYDDNRDEYDDYDEAYEGFLDDESAWDDY